MEDGRQSQAVEATYRARVAERQAAADHLERRHAQLAWTRLALFLSGIAILIALGAGGAPWLAIPIVAFIPLLFVHARVLNARDRATRAVAFYQRGLARLTDSWAGTGERGDRYRDSDHPYAEDLDLFGAGGLFELLITSRTRGGEDMLAGWLLSPASPGAVRERQHAVRELASKLDLREELAVLGPELDQTVRTEDLRAWATAPVLLTEQWPRLVLPFLSAATAALIGYWIWTATPPDALIPLLIVQGLIARYFRTRAHHVAHGVEEREQELRLLALLMSRIEQEPVEAPRLRELRDRLRATGRSPAEEVARLARLIDFLSSGHNLMFAPISALLMLGTQLSFAVEAWRRRCGSAVPVWLDAVAEYEALSALSTYAAEHPTYPFPEFVSGEALFDAAAIEHPLLPIATTHPSPERPGAKGEQSRGVAVPNDVRLGSEWPHLLLVSGSNMSGKSTLLRTVGLNAVLAQAGAPTRAAQLRMSPLRIGATLRIQDSLQAGRSRFFAEISRISAIVQVTEQSKRDDTGVLFLLDELLAGTNSHDRLAGATGILKGLLDHGAIGLATTHDLALTSMVSEVGQRAANVHFEDRFANGTLIFDYRLKPGVVKTSNALALMRAVGLDV